MQPELCFFEGPHPQSLGTSPESGTLGGVEMDGRAFVKCLKDS